MNPPQNVRDEQRSRTRERIRWAVLELLDSRSPASISVPAVAEQAGVSLRTVYRYFPSKEALLHSASHWYDDRARTHSGLEPNAADNAPFLAALWNDFAENLNGVRAQHRSPGGREVRAIRLEEWRERVDALLESRLSHLPDRERKDTVDLVVALSSSSMFLELVDRMGHDPTHAAELVTEVVELLVRSKRNDLEGE